MINELVQGIQQNTQAETRDRCEALTDIALQTQNPTTTAALDALQTIALQPQNPTAATAALTALHTIARQTQNPTAATAALTALHTIALQTQNPTVVTAALDALEDTQPDAVTLLASIAPIIKPAPENEAPHPLFELLQTVALQSQNPTVVKYAISVLATIATNPYQTIHGSPEEQAFCSLKNIAEHSQHPTTIHTLVTVVQTLAKKCDPARSDIPFVILNQLADKPTKHQPVIAALIEIAQMNDHTRFRHAIHILREIATNPDNPTPQNAINAFYTIANLSNVASNVCMLIDTLSLILKQNPYLFRTPQVADTCATQVADTLCLIFHRLSDESTQQSINRALQEGITHSDPTIRKATILSILRHQPDVPVLEPFFSTRLLTKEKAATVLQTLSELDTGHDMPDIKPHIRIAMVQISRHTTDVDAMGVEAMMARHNPTLTTDRSSIEVSTSPPSINLAGDQSLSGTSHGWS